MSDCMSVCLSADYFVCLRLCSVYVCLCRFYLSVCVCLSTICLCVCLSVCLCVLFVRLSVSLSIYLVCLPLLVFSVIKFACDISVHDQNPDDVATYQVISDDE